MTLGDNKLHPLEIADARSAAFSASERQREVEDLLTEKGKALADAERAYRRELTKRILALHAGEDGQPGLAITTCETVAKGEEEISQLRHDRDIAKAAYKSVEQMAFTRGADRRTLDRFIDWSMHRDLRTDTPPPGFNRRTLEPVS